MKNHIITFSLSVFLGLVIGYFAYEIIPGIGGSSSEVATETTAEQQASSGQATETKNEATATTTVAEDTIFKTKGCLGCHSIGGLNLQGGATGPDLSQAYNNVEGKHGKPINEFLKEPTSAVMSSVISGNPLTDEEINEVVGLLKQASEK